MILQSICRVDTGNPSELAYHTGHGPYRSFVFGILLIFSSALLTFSIFFYLIRSVLFLPLLMSGVFLLVLCAIVFSATFRAVLDKSAGEIRTSIRIPAWAEKADKGFDFNKKTYSLSSFSSVILERISVQKSFAQIGIEFRVRISTTTGQSLVVASFFDVEDGQTLGRELSDHANLILHDLTELDLAEKSVEPPAES